jgi:hypothetical protein
VRAGRMLAVAVLVAAVVGAPPADQRHVAVTPVASSIDVKVALAGPTGVCGRFADSLPVLVARSGMQPGAVTDTVRVCVRNAGTRTGRASLRVTELVEVETSCGPGEAEVDTTCAAGAAGELGSRLTQELGACAAGSPYVSVPFLRLTAQPAVVAGNLKKGQTVCAALRLRYVAPTATDRAAAQTDRVTWRYTIALTG